MKTKIFPMMLITMFGLFGGGCHSQDSGKKQTPADRQPAVAGQFYSANPEELKSNLRDMFRSAVPSAGISNIRAVLVPHAGYVFSGQVAASAINQLDPEAEYKRIFIIGSSHRTAFDAASVYAEGNFITPLGKVPVDAEAAQDLISKSKWFRFFKDAHWHEHSLEVAIPFLQYHLKKPFSIVPIVLGTDSPATCKEIAAVLKPYMNAENLFVISTDFSHYPDYDNALKVDGLTAAAILKNDPEALMQTLQSNAAMNIRQLATSLCGWTSVLTLLHMTKEEDGYNYKEIQYRNSADSPYGDSNRVVGYYAMLVSGPAAASAEENEFTISEQDKKHLLTVARNTLEAYINHRKYPDIDASEFSDNLKKQCGAFVTLHKDKKLRGCIGRFTADIPLYEVVRDMAVSSATQDHRFSPVTPDEISAIDIEISVLSPMRKISSPDQIELGKHGIYIIKGSRSGTFLPQVATETGWNKEEFLGHCAATKRVSAGRAGKMRISISIRPLCSAKRSEGGGCLQLCPSVKDSATLNVTTEKRRLLQPDHLRGLTKKRSLTI
jgi:MEMO1 family protein